jgi:mono/diheme cytochrome c family protein
MSADMRRVRAVAILLLPFSLAACPDTFTNFTRQPKIDPWESVTTDTTVRRDSIPPRGNPQGSVPIYGGSPPDFLVSYGRFPLTVDSMSPMRNPTEPSDASIENGRKYYSINCAVCHGDTGEGNGAVTKYNFPMISLKSASALGRSDGYIYGMIRNGRGLMPTYNRIEHMDRWDVVNYVRGLQGRLGRTVPTGPVGTPGETGAKVPGPTMTAPTRPAPHNVGTGVAGPIPVARDTVPAGVAGGTRPPGGER